MPIRERGLQASRETVKGHSRLARFRDGRLERDRHRSMGGASLARGIRPDDHRAQWPAEPDRRPRGDDESATGGGLEETPRSRQPHSRTGAAPMKKFSWRTNSAGIATVVFVLLVCAKEYHDTGTVTITME